MGNAEARQACAFRQRYALQRTARPDPSLGEKKKHLAQDDNAF